MTFYRNGAIAGILFGLLTSVLTSYIYGNGAYYPMSPYASATKFYESFTNELGIFVIAIACWSLIGIMFALAGRIYQNENWSIIQMTAAHFIIVAFCLFPLSIVGGWYPLTFGNVIEFFVIFIVLYIIFWTISFMKNYLHIKRINEKLNNS